MRLQLDIEEEHPNRYTVSMYAVDAFEGNDRRRIFLLRSARSVGTVGAAVYNALRRLRRQFRGETS